MTLIEIRCPSDLRRLFMKLKVSGETPRYTPAENWLEIACFDCLRAVRKKTPQARRVLHYYSFLGELMDTRVVF